MGRRRLTLKQLTRILASYGVTRTTRKRGKGSHHLFEKTFDEGTFSYPIPDQKDVLPCYVRGARKKFRLREEDGVTDEKFYSRG